MDPDLARIEDDKLDEHYQIPTDWEWILHETLPASDWLAGAYTDEDD